MRAANRHWRVLVEGISAALSDNNKLIAELGDALARFAWLCDEYSPRADPVGTMWRHARNAAQRWATPE